MNVLVTDGETRSALATTRSLGRKGCRVIVTSSSLPSLASSSRFCAVGEKVPNPMSDAVAYAEVLLQLVQRESIDIVFPMTEQSIQSINNIRDRFVAATVLACPSQEDFEKVANKSDLFKLAETLDVPIPKTMYLNSASDLPAVIHRIENFPVVVKPALSKVKDGNNFLPCGVRYAHSLADLQNQYASNPVLAYPSMIQEMIVGKGTGLFSLFDGDRHLALFSHERIREKPPSGGVSVVSQSIPLDENMVEAAGRLLKAVGWKGVAMVEFKRDQRDGLPKLMEINGRFWGSLQLAIECGVDFPSLLMDYLRNQLTTPNEASYCIGKKMKWFWGTLDHLIITLKNQREEFVANPHDQTKTRAIMEFCKIFEKNSFFDVFQADDRRPFCFETVNYFTDVFQKRR